MSMYLQPRSLSVAIDALAAREGRILAGGTDFYPALGVLPANGPIIDISRLDELNGIAATKGVFRIGAATTWSEIAKASLPPCFDGLKAAARDVGAIQIQNRATLGGNLCNASPAADGVPALLALDATLILASPGGERRLGLDRFVLGNRRTALRPDEILVAIEVPRRFETYRSRFIKLGARRYLVISIVMVAVALEVDEGGTIADARIAVGACSPVAMRLLDLEADLRGRRADAGSSGLVEARHLAALSPIADLRASAAYRRHAATKLVERTIDACLGI